jgi:2-methylcitrate dehydratase PrpD
MSAIAPLACFAATLSADRIDADLIDKARSCVLYGLAVGIATVDARADDHCGDLLGEVAGHQARWSATRLLDQKKLPVAGAALSNAMLLHRRIQEDSHPAGHVGVVVIPTALACAEATGASGEAFLLALIAGYEVALRIARDHVVASSRRGFRSTSLYGVFGAAVAASRLLNRNCDQATVERALGIAAQFASGLRGFVESGTDEYLLHAGMAASQGIAAAQFARAPLAISADGLEGPAGFFQATGEADNGLALSRLGSGFDDGFEFSAVTYKPYPCCQFHRNLVRGIIALSLEAGDQPVRSITIRMHPFEADFFGVRYPGPFSAFPQTFMSAPFCAALAWLDRDLSYRRMHDFDAADVLALVGRIEVVADPAVGRYHPVIEVDLSNRSSLIWKAEHKPDGYVLDWTAACRMALQLGAEAGLDEQAMRALIHEVRHIEQAPDLGGLLNAIGALIPAHSKSRSQQGDTR